MRQIVAANSGVMLRVGGGYNAFSAHRNSSASTSRCSRSSRSNRWLTTGRVQPNKMSEEVHGEQEDRATVDQHAASGSLTLPPTGLASETATKANPSSRSGQTVQTFEYEGSEPQFQFPLTLGPAIEDALTA